MSRRPITPAHKRPTSGYSGGRSGSRSFDDRAVAPPAASGRPDNVDRIAENVYTTSGANVYRDPIIHRRVNGRPGCGANPDVPTHLMIWTSRRRTCKANDCLDEAAEAAAQAPTVHKDVDGRNACGGRAMYPKLTTNPAEVTCKLPACRS